MWSKFASKPLETGDGDFDVVRHHHSIGCSESEDEILNVGNVSFHCMSEEEIDMFPPPSGKYLLRSPTSSTASYASSTPEEQGMEQTLEETTQTISQEDVEAVQEEILEGGVKEEVLHVEEPAPQEEVAADPDPHYDLVDQLRYLVDTNPFIGDLILTASEVADEYNNSIADQLSPINQQSTAQQSPSMMTLTAPKKKNRLLAVGKKMKRLPKSLFRR